MMQTQARAVLVGMALGSGTVLSAGPPNVGELAQNLAAPRRWVELAGPDAAVACLAGALLWLVALWVAVSLALTAGSLLPGRVGALARAIARRLTPAMLRRTVIAAAGASILLTPATALAAPGAAGSPGTPSRAPTAIMPAIGWPVDSSARPADAAPGVPSARPSPPAGPSRSVSPADPSRSTVPTDSGPTLPTDPSAGPDDPNPRAYPDDPNSSTSPINPGPTTSRTSQGPSAPAATTPAPRTAPGAPPGTRQQDGSSDHLAGQVTVRPGDSLWSIAAERLGADPSAARVQAEWPRWYATNRSLIGTDPGLIRPGTRLTAPQPTSTDTGA